MYVYVYNLRQYSTTKHVHSLGWMFTNVYFNYSLNAWIIAIVYEVFLSELFSCHCAQQGTCDVVDS